jgi:phage I-like protein
MTRVIQLDNLVELSSEPPQEFRLFGVGENETSKGLVLFDDDSAASVMSRYEKHGTDLPIDYGHGMLSVVTTPDSGVAAGWFSPETREDGLYAVNVEWTEKASKALRAREYRYFSPAIEVDDDGRMVGLINVALTNLPATVGQTPLVAHNKPQGDEMSELLKALGAESEAQGVVIAKEFFDWSSKVLSAVGVEKIDDTAVEKIEQLKAQATSALELADKLAKSEAELKALQADQEQAQRAALLDSMTEAGKIVPSARSFWETLTLDQLRQYDDTAQSVAPEPVKPAKNPIALSDDERAVFDRDCKPLGITEEQFVAARRAKKEGDK